MAGYYPETNADLMRFSERVRDDAAQLDLLASYVGGETRLCRRYAPNVRAFPLGDFEPYWHTNPWTAALKGKKVLVINPFAKTIEMQYAKRKELFANPDTLPDFDLKTYRAISSFGGNTPPYKTWFDALDHMCSDISKIDFDVALIGAGSYGMCLGAYIKRNLGKKALHTGGMTQMIFGIRGKRWDVIERYQKEHYNDAWTRPLPEETISNSKNVECGGYW